MKEKAKRITAGDIILLVLSLCLALGAALVFGACAAHGDGSVMTCHWAGRAVVGTGAAMSALALARLAVGRRARLGSDLAFIALAGLAALLPGRLVSLCMMESMRCRAVMRPAVLVLSALIALAAAADAWTQRK